jgi:hypothetical protein
MALGLEPPPGGRVRYARAEAPLPQELMPPPRRSGSDGDKPPLAGKPFSLAPGEAFTWHSESDAPAPTSLPEKRLGVLLEQPCHDVRHGVVAPLSC